MVELNRVDEVQRFRTYKIYGKHHLPHYGEHKLVATIHMNTGDNSLADCENLPVLFMNAQTYRDDAMRLRSEIEQKDREISRLQAGVEQALRERDHAVEALLMQVEQIDRDATEYYGTAIGYPEKDPSGDILRTAFARHRHQVRAEVVGEIVAWLQSKEKWGPCCPAFIGDEIEAKFGGDNGQRHEY